MVNFGVYCPTNPNMEKFPSQKFPAGTGFQLHKK